jgi:predicted nucleic acid-binding protein
MEKARQKHYFDACTLESGTGVYGLILNKLHPNDVIVSHLSLGEAYGNSLLGGEDKTNAFVGLIQTFQKYIKVVDHDGIDHIIKDIWDCEKIKLKMADAIHLATAIKNGCSVFHTSDGDFCNGSSDGFREVAKKYNIDDFQIAETEVPFKCKSKYGKKQLVRTLK